MNNALVAIIIAIGGISLACLLVSRMQGRQRHPRRWRDGVGSDGGYYAGDDIGNVLGFSRTHHSPSSGAAPGDSAGSHDTGGSGDLGGGDSGGGGSE